MSTETRSPDVLQTIDGSEVFSIGCGTWGYGGFFNADRTRDTLFQALLSYAVDIGFTLLDTAESYGQGHCEELFVPLCKTCRDKLFVASKVSPEHLTYKEVVAAADRSLQRMQTDYIDLYQIHWPNPCVPLSETMMAMDDLVVAGKIRYVGVSNFSCRQLKEALALCSSGIRAIQVEFSLFDRSIEEDLLPFCRQNGIAVIAYSPLDRGRSVEYSEKTVLRQIAARHRVTATQVILNWLVSHCGVIPIPSSTKEKHLRDNAASLSFSLSGEEAALIDREFPLEIEWIDPRRIIADREGLKDFVPGPGILAEKLQEGESLKPVRVVPDDTFEKFKLTEGRLRFWSWVTAFGEEEPIPALVRYSKGGPDE